jgi:hypothetical protein
MRCLILLRGYNQGAHIVCRTLTPALCSAAHITTSACWQTAATISSTRVGTICNHPGKEHCGCAVAAHEQAASGGWDVCAATKDSYDFKHRVGITRCRQPAARINLSTYSAPTAHISRRHVSAEVK